MKVRNSRTLSRLIGNVSYFAICERDEHGRCAPGTGTAVHCGKDIKLAAQMLAKGAKVVLDQPDQVSTLLRKMHKMVQKAVERGEDAPKFDLCKVSVSGSNLFCAEHIGIPRVKMPQMRGMPVEGSEAAKLPRNKVGKVDVGEMFVQHLQSKGIKVEQVDVRASHLRASQNEIDGARIADLVTTRSIDELRKRPVFVTKDNYVVDGHHHWAAIVGKGAAKDKDYKVPVYKLDTDIGTALGMANDYAKQVGIKPKSTPTSNWFTVNPFVSEAQRAWMHANHPEMAKEWESKTGKKKLPKRVDNAKRASRRDPTRTTRERVLFVRRLRKQFATLKRFIVRLVDTEDSFGLQERKLGLNADYQFASSPDKVTSFQKHLAQLYKGTIASTDAEAQWNRYIMDGFKKGANRSFEDVKAKDKAMGKESLDFYKGSKEQFLRSSFNQPETVEKAKLLAGRAFDELEDVSSRMSTLMSRSLTDSLVQGRSPREAAKELAKVVDIGLTRATLIARTEIIRAHAEGQLVALEGLGVTQVGAMVEWSTAGDDDVCPECDDMEGETFDIDDARGMLPLHPNCRCAWVPAVPEPDDDDDVTDNRSFFADCERDERGRCAPADGAGRVSEAKLKIAQAKAKTKARQAPKPTREEVQQATVGIAKLGANKYRRNLVGNTGDRARRREILLKEFGDGKQCPCVYCGLRLEKGTLEQDKIRTTAEGGRYRTPNLVPACSSCNKARGDLPWKSIKWA